MANPQDIQAFQIPTIQTPMDQILKVLNGVGGESLAVGDGNELAQQLEELLKQEVEKIDPEEDFDF